MNPLAGLAAAADAAVSASGYQSHVEKRDRATGNSKYSAVGKGSKSIGQQTQCCTNRSSRGDSNG